MREEDIIEEQIERVNQGREEVKKRNEKRRHIKKQKEKELRINLYFPKIKRDGELWLEFGERADETEEWIVKCFIPPENGSTTISFSKPFSQHKEAVKYFQKLYQKHELEENRVAYIDNEIALKERYREKCKKNNRIDLGIDSVLWGFIAVIVGALVYLFTKSILAGIATTVIAFIFLCVFVINETLDRIQIRTLKKEIEELKTKRTKSDF